MDRYSVGLLRPAGHWLRRGEGVNQVTYDILTHRIKQLGNLPAMPAILSRLCETLSLKSQIDVDNVVQEISYDKSLTAQCLRLANSALFRRRGDVSTVREAVLAGLLHDIGILVNGVLFADDFSRCPRRSDKEESAYGRSRAKHPGIFPMRKAGESWRNSGGCR
jgi:hypothetical protein